MSTPHLARSRTPEDLYKCVRARACVCAKMRVSVCQNEGECMRARERAIHVLMIHSIFVMLLFFSFSLLYVQYKYSGFVTKLTSSAVTGIEVSCDAFILFFFFLYFTYSISLSSGPVLRHLAESSITTTEINL